MRIERSACSINRASRPHGELADGHDGRDAFFSPYEQRHGAVLSYSFLVDIKFPETGYDDGGGELFRALGLGSFSPHLCFGARVALALLSDVVANYTRVSVALVHQKSITPIRPVL